MELLETVLEQSVRNPIEKGKEKGIRQMPIMPNPLFLLWCRSPDLNRDRLTPTRP
jgi:hypothetical protein